jgi:UDP-N-acetylglucosamine--N-acetylmuramyl-(pentapeptide) pyrophosphoryl-undecaprenol N-acetylglucosamine transferase
MHIGNPVRASIADLAATRTRLESRHGPIRLFVMGGSLGARHLNEVLPQTLAVLDESVRPVVRHQTGKQHLDTTVAEYQRAGVEANVEAFIDDMAEVYNWADLVIARAGALTIAELSQVGLASILVPFPHAVDDHQTANAKVLVERGAACLISDRDLTHDSLLKALQPLLNDREKLITMGEMAHQLARPEAAERIVDICLGARACHEVSGGAS